ncbi:MAG TPA: hypothetical protein VK922_05745 [Gemmatimonadaceae bacterium]|nr:hypothetical protein [Gemmatimonadaceae bacterium]
MIVANVRRSLTRDDAQLALRLIARGSADAQEAAEAALREDGIDGVLDDPTLLGALMEHPLGARASLPLFCYVVVRNALRRAGEADRSMADYTAAIVLHFGARGAAHRISAADDEQYDTLAALLRDAESADARRAFLVRAHLGNYALWLSGLFPDHIEHRRWRRGGPDLQYYEEMGRRGFLLAADHRLARDYGMAALFQGAAERFGRLRAALNAVSDAMLFPNVHTPERLMRQVADEAHWRQAS